MPWDVTYTARCALCLTEVEQGIFTLMPGLAPPLPSLPPNWWTFNGEIYCELHHAVVEDV